MGLGEINFALLFFSAPWNSHIRESRLERFVVLFHTRLIRQHVEQILRHGISTSEIVVPKTNGCKGNACNRMQFNAGQVIFQAGTRKRWISRTGKGRSGT